VRGVLELQTRCDTWHIQPRKKAREEQGEGAGSTPAPVHPWTRFNNSASIDSQGIFEDGPDAFEAWAMGAGEAP
jgi:hypothetical protein